MFTQHIARELRIRMRISFTFLMHVNARVSCFIFLFHIRLIRLFYSVYSECSTLHSVQV